MHSFTHLLARLFTISALRYIIIAGIPFIIFYGLARTRYAPNKIQEKDAQRKDFLREILHSLQTTLVLAIIAWLVLYTPLKKYTLVYHRLSDYSAWWLAGSVIFALIIHDTYFYWMHRLLHHRTIFRFTHLLHHRSTNPSPWTSYSFHFMEAWTEGAVLLPIVFIVPIHPLGILLFTVSGFIINVYGHLGYEIMPKNFRNSFLFEVFNTSTYHNLHHSKFKGNYGLYFRVWDRLMGTENPDYVKEYDRIQARRFPDLVPTRPIAHPTTPDPSA